MCSCRLVNLKATPPTGGAENNESCTDSREHGHQKHRGWNTSVAVMNDHALCHFFCENRFTESKLRRMSAQSRCYSRVKSRMLLRFALKKSRRTSIGCGVMNFVWSCSSFYPQSPSEATWGAGRSMNRHCDWHGGNTDLLFIEEYSYSALRYSSSRSDPSGSDLDLGSGDPKLEYSRF